MASSKARRGLGEIFRHVMRNHPKPLDETVSLSFMPELLSSLKSSDDSSNTGQGKPSGSNRLQERNEGEGSSETSDFFFRKVHLSPRRKLQESRCRVQTDDYKKKESQFMKKLVKGYDQKFGTETMFDVWAIMGKEVGVNEYKTLIKFCIHYARRSNDVEFALDHIGKAIEYLKEINKLVFTIGKRTYEPLLKFLVDKGMVEEFQISKEVIIEANPDALGKVGYYEMLLWIQVGDEEKIHELCSTIDDSGNSLSVLQEHYLVALYENNRKENLQRLLTIVDITKVSSPNLLTNIFGYLGRSLLESMAMKFLRELRKCGKDGVKTVSNLIFSYATCIPNSTVKDAVLAFNKLHKELDIKPSSTSYEKLITYLYDSNEGGTALDVDENMREAGHSLLHSIDITKILKF